MKILFLIFLCCTINFLKSQPTIKDYEQKTILVSNGKYFLNNAPLTLQELVKKMEGQSTEGFMLATDSYKDFKKSKTLRLLSLGLFISPLFIISTNQNVVNYRRRQNIGLALYSTSFLFLGISANFISKSGNKMARAIWTYNRDVLFAK
jgi:hypothetical protein